MRKIVLNAVALGFLTFATFSLKAQVTQSDLDLRNAFKKSYESETALKYAKAIEDLAPFASSNAYEVNLRLGWLNYFNAKFAQSSAHYMKCIESAPKSVEARLGFINSLAALDKWDEVIAQYKEILKVDACNAKALYNLSLIYFNRLDYNTSWVYLTNYMTLYPFDFDGLNLAGWVKYNQGKKEEAISFFKKALLLNPSLKSYDAILGLK
jgi:tetratricopeptide (TPR) repeat protein